MTRFKYACFISYRNGYKVTDRLNTFSEGFAKFISSTVQGYVKGHVRDENGHNVFLDQHIFPDFIFDLGTLSSGLCKSIVWIVLYTRDYLDGSMWCASELEGMTRLEKHRLQQMSEINNPDIGFVVPVILSGRQEEMPPFLQKRKKHIIDLRHLYLRKNFADETEFTDLLTDLLDKIGIVQRVVLGKNSDICSECHQFRLCDVSTSDGLDKINAFVSNLYPPPQPTV